MTAMRTFLRKVPLTYAIVVGLLILWSWCAVLTSLHEVRELPTGPELLLYMVSFPMSYALKFGFNLAPPFISWQFTDTFTLTVLSTSQAVMFYLLAKLAPRTRRIASTSTKYE